MMLATPTDLLNSYGWDDMTDSRAAVTSALNAATPHLAAKLNMPSFTRGTASDVFFVNGALIGSGGVNYNQMRLSYGLLTSTAITVVRASTFDGLASGTDITSSFQVDREKGVLSDFTNVYESSLVKVTYEHGLSAKAAPYDDQFDGAPDWLKEAAMLQAMILLSSHPIFEEAKIKQDTKTLRYSFEVMMANHLRYAPNALLPM